MSHPDELVTFAEIVVPFADPRTAIPGELDRAINAWNEMTERVKRKVPGAMHIPRVETRGPLLIKAYRKWKKAIGKRDYLLEQLIADVEAQPYIWPTIRFPWLFRVKDGDFNSDKIHARAFGKGGNGKSDERDYLGLARRVGAWQRDHDHLYVADSGSYESAFENGTGISWQKWEQLRARFNGASA